MAKIKFLKDGTLSEETIHKFIINYIDAHPKLSQFRKFIIHFPNEGKRSQRYGALMKALGMRKGVSDLFIAVPRHNFGGAWIELKSEKGTLSLEQKQFLEDMKSQNFYVCVCYSINNAIERIEWYFRL